MGLYDLACTRTHVLHASKVRLYINYQLDALIIIYTQNTILLYMFRDSGAHLQEDTVVYMQHMSKNLICVPTVHQELS